MYTRLFVTLLLCGIACFSFGDTPEDKEFHRNVRFFLHKYCASCHNDSDKKGGIALDDYYFVVHVVRRGELFKKVVEMVELGKMPPSGKPQMSKAERDTMITGIKKILNKALMESDPGESIMRRLSHREYSYTVLDLIGVEFDAQGFFPSEGSGGEGFDNQSGVLFISPLTIERYYEAADSIVRLAQSDPELWRQIVPGNYNPWLGRKFSYWWTDVVMDKPISVTRPLVEAEKFLIPFATKAYRRFMTEEEKAQLRDLFQKVYRQEWRKRNGFEIAMRECIKAVLISPSFLYRHEANLPLDAPYRVNNFELANRLSYLLWSSMPDETLFNVAYREDLHDPEVLRRETLRMIEDPKFERFAEAFAGQWLEVEQILREPKADPEKFPELNMALREAMYNEAIQYFYHVFTKSRNLLELIDSDYTYLNEQLSEHYGIPFVSGNEMRPVTLADRTRGGVLGMGAVLTVTSLPLRTSPVIRGKWVLEQVLGTPPPPPPPDVPELEEAKDQVENELDLRALLELHAGFPACSGCHQKMDPIGLGLENFDAIGRWREHYDGHPIDPSGVLMSGESFNGIAELKQILCEKKADFARNLSKKLLSYALGRGIVFKDTPTLDLLTNSMLENNFDSQSLMLELVMSYPFRYKRSDMAERYKGI